MTKYITSGFPITSICTNLDLVASDLGAATPEIDVIHDHHAALHHTMDSISLRVLTVDVNVRVNQNKFIKMKVSAKHDSYVF